MFIQLFNPIEPLRKHISMIWAFESPEGIPPEDARLIAPNGCMKLIVPYRKRVTSHIGKSINDHTPLSCIIVGQMLYPVNIESEAGGGTIGIEFKASSATYFFRSRLDQYTDQVCSTQEVWETSGARMQEQLSNIETIAGKVEFLQRYLLRRIQSEYSNKIVEYAVSKIVVSAGFVSISELSEDIGYSRQHLSRLFSEYVGVSPKEFARIARFQQFYSRINTASTYELPDDLYDHYYDQSHFIKEFQRFLGYTPGDYRKIRNDFGKLFYIKDVPFLQ
jgi:AraC-like DNA-binding protein